MARWLAAAATLTLGVRAAVDALRVAAEIEYHGLFTRSGRSPGALQGAMARLAELETISTGLLCVAAPSFVGWLFVRYRAVPDRHRSAGWAFGSWVVPGLNLVEPYRIVREVWDGGRTGRTVRAPWLVFSWWCACLASVVTVLGVMAAESRAHARLAEADRDGALREAVLSGRLAITAALLSTIAAALGAGVVLGAERRLSGRGSG